MEQIEGKICVEAALKARQRKITLIILRSGIHPLHVQSILAEAEQQQIPVKYASREELETMAHGKTHGGVIALAMPKPCLPVESILERIHQFSDSPALLLLEGVDDSQNLGFILRTADAMGIHAVLLKKHLWDFDSNAVSRASSGVYERMPLVLLDQAEIMLPKFSGAGIKIYGCIANAKRTLHDADFTIPVMLAIGGEKRGLSAAVRRCCTALIRIPMMSAIGSLSMSHAAAIVLAEVMRQRGISLQNQ